MLRRTILIAGLACGLLLSTTVRAADTPAWTLLSPTEQAVVDAVAADLWREAGGRVPYARIGEAEKAAVRDAAMRKLGVRRREVARRWV